MTRPRLTVLAIFGLAAFCAVFVLVDQTNYEFVSARFPPVGSSAALATLWGLLSRGHVILLTLPLVVWRPRFFGSRSPTWRTSTSPPRTRRCS